MKRINLWSFCTNRNREKNMHTNFLSQDSSVELYFFPHKCKRKPRNFALEKNNVE